MGAPILAPRAARLLGWATVLAVLVVGCDPDPMDPGTLQFGPLRIHPVLESAVDPALLNLDAIRVTIRRLDDGMVVSDTVLGFDASADEVLAWVLGLEGLPTDVTVEAEVRKGAVAMFTGTVEVEVLETSPARPSEIHDVAMGFVGPGTDAVAFTVTPDDALLTFGETLQYQLAAVDADGNPVADPVVVWSSSDPALAPIGAGGRLEAPGIRGTVAITAQSPTGVSDDADARFQPAPAELLVLAGDGARAPVTQTVTLTVRVTGSDGLGVEGTAVTFEPPAGAAVSSATVSSGPDGAVSTDATLGTAAGPYVFGASAEGLAPVILTITAESGPATLLAFRSEPAAGEVGGPLSPTVTVELRDAFGNPTGDGTPVTLALGTNPTGATLSGAGPVTTVGGVATFASLSVDLAGIGYTLVATAPGLPDVESGPFDVTQVPRSVTVTPDAATLVALAETVNLSAAAFDAADRPIPDQAFTWSSSDESVATVDQNGVVTAIDNGTATITARAGDASADASIEVEQQAAAVQVTPGTATLTAFDQQVQLSALVTDANGFAVPDQSVMWSSLASGVAEVDQTGLVTARANGNATVRAASGSTVGTAAITVEQQVSSVSVTPVMVAFDALQDQAVISRVALDANGNVVANADFAWSSDNDEVAVVDLFGVITSVANGDATVTATAGGISADVAVSVDQVPVQLQGFPDLDTLFALGEVVTLTADARDANGFIVPDVMPTWSTPTPTIADVTPEGVATTLANGDARFVAALGELRDTVTVTVEQRVAVVVVTPEVVEFDALGAAAQLTVEGQDANGFPVPGIAAPEWLSDLPNVVSVDQTGALLAQSNGETAVRARIGETEGLASVVVRQVVVALRVTPDAVTFDALQDQVLLVATGEDANGFPVTDADVLWSSNDDAVAGVDAAGTVTAEGNGATVITAAADGVSASANVMVQQVATSLEVTPPSATLVAFAEQTTLIATARDANGFPVPSVTPAWSSLAPTIADVDPASGVVTAVDNGTTTIEASADDLVGSAAITVQQVVATVQVAPTTLGFTALGETGQLTAEPRDANGFPAAGAPAPVWTSDLPAIASVDQGGQVTAEDNGQTTVHAEIDGVEGSAAVSVQQRVTTIALTVTCPAQAAASPLEGGAASTVVGGCDTLTALGAQAIVEAEARDANGFLVTDPVITWSSLAPAVASVDDAGVVTAVANGTATIRAEADDAVAEVDLVVQQVVATLVIAPAEATLAPNESVHLIATAFDANGFVVPDPQVAWISFDPLIASVTQDGLVTAHRVGETMIEANANGPSATAAITVQ